MGLPVKDADNPVGPVDSAGSVGSGRRAETAPQGPLTAEDTAQAPGHAARPAHAPLTAWVSPGLLDHRSGNGSSGAPGETAQRYGAATYGNSDQARQFLASTASRCPGAFIRLAEERQYPGREGLFTAVPAGVNALLVAGKSD
ncbi:hypothetical protein [Streptomyces sp. NPDC059788]|uniref:hypothetical protein n=1 Tax=Streptomyces sp. NPDC059788 TaxID=3346948 RepID=UPI0036490D6D